MDALALGDLILKVIGGVILFVIGIVIARFTFSIGKIVRLLTEIADSLASRDESDDQPEKEKLSDPG